MLRTTRYPVTNPLLKNIINYFWVLESESEVSVNHKLLPVSNVDMIFNFCPSPITYINEEGNTETKSIHLNGIHNRFYSIIQTGKLKVFGVSFLQAGLFPILRTPLNEITDKTINVDDIITAFTDDIMEKVSFADSDIDIIKVIENKIVHLLDYNLMPEKIIYKILKLCASDTILNINDLCNNTGINRRTIERVFNKYVGISPKLFARINRFQKTIKELNHSNSLTSIAYDFNYFDQTHFIKDFKSFVGCTPTEFINKNTSIKQIIKYS